MRYQEIEKTEAELKFEEAQRQRVNNIGCFTQDLLIFFFFFYKQMERVSKAANKSHKDRVSEFNQKLEKLSEHHDIPKVGPG